MLVKRYETTLGSACGCEEHRLIFKALAGRERGKAVKAMSSHLSLVETRLRPIVCDEAGPSLEALLEEAIAAFRAERGEDKSPRHEAPAASAPR
jgi:hypothetical protein